jgi:hypothetical protein
MHHTHTTEMRQMTNTTNGSEDHSDKRLTEIWNSQLIRSIRNNHANLSSIAEYEEEEALSKDSVDTWEELPNL